MTQVLNQNVLDPRDGLAIRTIEKATVVISLLMLMGGLLLWPSASIIGGIFCGSLVGLANFRFLKRIVAKILDEKTLKQSRNGIRFALKVILLFGIIGFLIAVVKINAIAFVIGFSSIILAIFYEGIKSLF